MNTLDPPNLRILRVKPSALFQFWTGLLRVGHQKKVLWDYGSSWYRLKSTPKRSNIKPVASSDGFGGDIWLASNNFIQISIWCFIDQRFYQRLWLEGEHISVKSKIQPIRDGSGWCWSMMQPYIFYTFALVHIISQHSVLQQQNLCVDIPLTLVYRQLPAKRNLFERLKAISSRNMCFEHFRN